MWSDDTSTVEFSVKLPIDDVEGMVMGFNIALADNDGGGREVQLYPITGENRSYMGVITSYSIHYTKLYDKGFYLFQFPFPGG